MLNYRVGFGNDIHKITSGDGLIIGGIKVECDMAFVAHSDGDILLHAITDALLGALALGDIGDHFPPSNPLYKDQTSLFFVKKALMLIKKGGYHIGNIDATITLEKPKLKEYKIKIKQNLATLLGLNNNQVSIKAKTAEGQDSVGMSLSAKAEVIVLLIASSSIF